MGPLSHYDLHQLSVLVVEKHDTMRRILVGILHAMGLRDIRQATDPDAGFAAFRDAPADLVFTDWAPGLDGIRLLRRIRADDASPDPFAPVIVVSANTELRHIYQARDAGMTEFLGKPFKAKLIYARICAVIERHRVFIRNPSFFGPDRRRRRVRFEGPDRRRHANRAGFDRRSMAMPFAGAERRQGYPAFHEDDRRLRPRGAGSDADDP